MRAPASLLLTAVAVTAAALATGATAVRSSEQDGDVDVQILGINDFHGRLEPPTGKDSTIDGIPAGGAEYLATHLERLERTNPNTIVVSAGDLFGRSGPLSAWFHDDPTVEAMNEMGLDLDGMGNHELDAGVPELRRQADAARFPLLAANTVTGDDHTLFPPYAIEAVDGVRIAFIGLTLEGTRLFTPPDAVRGLRFLDEADTANALMPELRRQGVEAIVVLLHEGGDTSAPTVDGCPGISGPVVDIVRRMDDEIDLVLSGHTHRAYRCRIDGTLVTSAASYGRVVTDVDLRIDRRSGDVTSVAADNRIVTRDVAPDPAITRLIDRYRTRSIS